jgi:hypothetical protein
MTLTINTTITTTTKPQLGDLGAWPVEAQLTIGKTMETKHRKAPWEIWQLTIRRRATEHIK